MMARGSSTTLIDPTSLSQRTTLAGSTNLVRSGSLGGKPLLNFDEDRSKGLQAPTGGRNTTRSVFGVDTLWEREMAKLKEIEAKEAEELRKKEAAEDLRLQRKANKKKKGKEKVPPQDVPVISVEESRVSAEVPTLPVIQRGITRGPPPPPNDDETESSDSSDLDGPQPHPAAVSADGWHSGESDQDVAGPVRTTGVGPRYPTRGRRQPYVQSVTHPVDDDDSEEDMPLAATVSRAVQRATRFGLSATENSDSDEEKPLSQLLVKSRHLSEASPPSDTDKTDYQPASAAPRHINKGNDGEDEDEEDEDDKPLGLRASRFMSSQSQLGNVNPEDEDDLPLALHPEQQRRTQYNMFLLQQQQQQQQQQLLLQAQMQQSMMFSPPAMMGPGFFGAPVMPQMMPMVPPPVPASPPPGAADMTKFTRVDRWRREIAGEP